ncbi:uncharacterized protein LOC128882503 [Hylaeus volcanicus]|uniref:uncharacterized protein LOC128882503 n=1 Tax=Hylaeus volcanicus TaxID=313075 RepID=UPI0023B828C0|nr:uncharacterized protein LOC128882503 [Hylaeus volcanicus]
MTAALGGLEVRVARPVKKAEFRLTGLDISVTSQEVVAAVAKAGGCTAETVRVGELKAPPNGLGTIWVQCPAVAALAIEKAKRIRVGWSLAQVVVLAARPLQCFRCLAVGHVRQRCTAAIDRSGHCYRCGSSTHRAAECREAPHCAVCAELGRPAGHKAGSKACSPPPKKKKGRRGVAGVAPPSAAARGGGGDATLPSTSSVPAAMEVEAVASGEVISLPLPTQPSEGGSVTA